MSDIDLYRAYNSHGENVHDLFDKIEEGLFVPLYQREYTWEEENINQLFDDLLLGIRELSNKNGDNAATFLGTVILTNLANKKDTFQKGEERAQPTAVQLVIDGQQRISTIALLAVQLTTCLKSLSDDLPDNTPYKVLKNHCCDLIETLRKLYTLKLGRGATPMNKPKIIRAKEDRWTYDGDDNSYRSPVAHYIATYIRTDDPNKALNAVDAVAGARVRGNVKLIDQHIDRVCNAHLPKNRLLDQFPVADKIVTDRMQKYVLGFSDDALKGVIGKAETKTNENDYFAAAIYHVFLLVYYLLRRCGVNRLQPDNVEWGFDMFQALNATGTPLTAMETFVPQVMQAEQAAGNDWVKTPSSEYMAEIDELFEQTKSNEQKNRRTNELLSAFALCFEGKNLGNKFSAQRRWMTHLYEKDLTTITEKREFLGNLARVANFFHAAWYMEDKSGFITGLDDHKQGEFISFLVKYLKDANSRLSAPILARFYSQALEDDAFMDEFVEASKSCAAFFTLWRSAKSTSGLDDIYRRFFKKHNWKEHPKQISSKSLKQYFRDELKHKQKDVDEKEVWITASERFLLYSEVKTICRFALFVAGHDRVQDPANPGLTAPGTTDVCPLLNLGRWTAKDHKSLEHVAPQRPPDENSWDPRIYTENKVHEIGNLLLLPTEINQFGANKDWAVKFLHYRHVGGRNKECIDRLNKEAESKGLVLNKKAIRVLSTTKYNCAVEPILGLGDKGSWDAEMIERRTRQIKELVWEMLMSWLK